MASGGAGIPQPARAFFVLEDDKDERATQLFLFMSLGRLFTAIRSSLRGFPVWSVLDVS